MNKLAIDIGTSFGSPFSALSDVGRIASALSNNLLWVAGVVLIFSIVFSGISMISSSGNPQGFERARTMLTASIIGFILVIGGYFITYLVEFMFGIDIVS